MKRLLLSFILLVCVILLGPSWAQPPDQSEVRLSLSEYDEIFTSANLKDAERRLQDQQKIQKREHEQKLADLANEVEKIQASRLEQESSRKMFPDNFQVLRHTCFGSYNSSSPDAGVESDVVSFELELIFRVMSPTSEWTTIPLVNTSATVAKNWQVLRQEEVDGDKDFQVVDTVSSPHILLLQRDGQQVLATNKNGLFKVSFNAYTRVAKTRHVNKMGLSSLLYPLSELSVRIAKTSPRSNARDFSVQPPSSVLYVQPEQNSTYLQATLPLTADNFQLRWVDVNDEQPDVECGDYDGHHDTPANATKPINDWGMPRRSGSKPMDLDAATPQVIATHEVMHTVGEGVLRSVHTLEFFTGSSEGSPLHAVQFLIHGKGARVASVVGHALQSWTSEVVQPNSTADSSSTLVKTAFKTSQQSSSIVLQVHTETDRDESTQAHVELPRIECQNVLRQTGHVGVTKDANVEIHEHQTTGLSPVTSSDLSSKLRLNVDRPIVLSYKYLNPDNKAVLSVTEHKEMETLDATIDRLHHKVVVTETHAVHSLILTLQSTKLQYLPIFHLPPSASKYTCLVNSVPAKPVKAENNGDENSILVPLLVGLNPETANQGSSLLTSVEVTYFSKHETFGENGTLSLDPPQFDLPVSILTSHVSLPSDRMYNFTGHYGKQRVMDKTLLYPIPEAFKYAKGKRVVEEDYDFTVLDDMFPEDREEQGKFGAVKIVTPKAGRNYYFQQTLVLEGRLELNVTYSVPPPLNSVSDPKKKSLLSRILSKILPS
mmetsp:Transcript_6887/g.14052  ORF Transcript_6887/g.14052 Transcript_6887/m.14052 type:complete len:772 (-) Transcript_6887:57-2372(-)